MISEGAVYRSHNVEQGYPDLATTVFSRTFMGTEHYDSFDKEMMRC